MSRYSQLYIERGNRLTDSPRMRVRLAAFVRNRLDRAARAEAEQRVTETLGVEAPYLGTFFETADLRDVLDAITVVGRTVSAKTRPTMANFWWHHVRTVFAEEHLQYRLADDGIVHPFVDAEFETNRSATLEALSDARLGEARADFEAAFRHLRDGEGKQAIRMMFPAVEVAAKVLVPGVMARLMPNEVERHFRPLIEAKYAGNQPAIDGSKRLLAAFSEWINASQPYRHGQEVQEPVEPPQDFVVAYLSAGATFLRWMTEIAG